MSEQAIYPYTRHPISAAIIQAKLREARRHLENRSKQSDERSVISKSSQYDQLTFHSELFAYAFSD